MNVRDVLRLALRIFKNNRLRTFLTILGISVGIATIVFLVAFGYGVQKITVEKITRADALLALDVLPNTGEKEKPITEQNVEKIAKIDKVAHAEPILQVSGQAEVNSGTGELHSVYGVGEEFFNLDGTSFKPGGSFSARSSDEIVVTPAVLELFSLKKDELPSEKIKLTYFSHPTESGETVRLMDNDEYRVVGVAIDNEDRAIVYLPYNNLRKYFPEKSISALKVKIAAQTDVSAVKSAISAMGYPVSTVIDEIEQLEKGFKVARISLGFLGIVALIVASIGMFNTLTIALLERIKEVGIMKALGASDSDIYKIFMAEAIMIGFLGGVVGIILGLAASTVVNIIFNTLAGVFEGQKVILFSFPIWFVISVILFSCLIAFITGIYPARRAARLNPLEALRYE
ncbi:MAG: Uncharacterized protein CEN89_426 [Candidatus Berkelbacteria bacterium Licking1014_7]|uniref:ABC transport system permease protein n=1 Tax=Candidatus Berkelbacteria bacterium Licking1014_7 TaxID=2017147 RepID=A0A554LJ22_9BACT|nr:MAG: Uncharacterized protein CEN89_426 [Candidatus Berkelbacteria bacterium Licking1014_7]